MRSLVALCLLTGTLIHAGTISLTGTLDPATNSNLTSWDQLANAYVPPVSGPTDADRAFNIAVHTFVVPFAGTVDFSSTGYGAGGFDSVLSVFSGTGNGATWVDHQFSPLMPGDFNFSLNLLAGTYTLAISMFGSQPCAPGFCMGATNSFGDGFTNLVNFDESRSLLYAVEITTPDSAVPEPTTTISTLIAVAALYVRGRSSIRSGSEPSRLPGARSPRSPATSGTSR